jgi:hypothetical protein
MGQLRIMNGSGDTKLIWEADNAAEVENARRTFTDLKAKKFKAFSVKKDGESGKEITEFDPALEKIIMIPQIMGG